MIIQAALVGFGTVARNGHLPWYLNNQFVKLTAVVEPTLQGRLIVQDLLPTVQTFSSLDALLNSQQVAFIDITAPPTTHADLISIATTNGIHVICEKPFVTSWQVLQRIREIRTHSRTTIAACHNWCFAPAIRRSLEYLAAGVIGEPERVSFIARRPQAATGANHWKPTWRESASEGGGIIADLGYHGIYLISRIFQRSAVYAQVNSVHQSSLKDSAESDATIKLDYGDGKHAELILSWLSTVRETSLRVYGSHGLLIISGEYLCIKTKQNYIEENFEALTADSWHASWTCDTLDWFLGLLQRNDNTTGWQDIEWSVAALSAVYDSINSGGDAKVVMVE